MPQAASGHVRNLPTLHFVQIVQLGVLGHQELSAKTSCQHDTSFNNLNRTMKLAASVEGETQKSPNFVPSSPFLGINSVVLGDPDPPKRSKPPGITALV